MPNATEANIGYLGLLKYGDGESPETFSEVIEVTNFPGFGAMSDILEATHLQSPNGAKEYVSGMDDGIEMPLTCNFRPDHASHSPLAGGLIYAQQQKLRINFTIEHPEWGGMFTFRALVRGFSFDLQANVVQQVTFTLKFTGGIVWVAD